MDRRELIGIIVDCSIPGMEFILGEGYLQLAFMAPDNDRLGSDEVTSWRGRKWRLSEHMTRSEVVRTAFMAYLAFVEHEARERFRYRGRAVFGPHIDVERLHDAASDFDRREDVAP